jgi:hypothetical protein
MSQSADDARVLYQGQFRLRSVPQLVIVALALMGVTIGYVAVADPFGLAAAPLLHLAVMASAVLVLLAPAYLLYGRIADARQSFTIRMDGILADGKLTPWSRIVSVSGFVGLRDTDVSPFFRTGAFGPPVRLMTDRPLTRQEYERLIALLRDEVGPLHPGLKLGGYEREVS